MKRERRAKPSKESRKPTHYVAKCDAPGSSTDAAPFAHALSSQLLSSGLCSTEDEARGVADAVAADAGLEPQSHCARGDVAGRGGEAIAVAADALCLYLDVPSREEAVSIVRTALVADAQWGGESGDGPSGDEDEPDSADGEGEPSEEDDDGEFIGEGECELCERTILLTRHHLIPKSTWPKMKRRILSAADAIADGDKERSAALLGGAELPPGLPVTVTPTSLRRYLQRVCKICRPCHTMVHQLHSEIELAERYNTMERLLEDEDLMRFCKWANKQRPGKYSVCK